MSRWDEIRKLAADLHRVQLGEAAKQLSERNCVEVMSRLIELKLVDVIFSVDGKEYITRQHLGTQIRNECIGNKGRVSLVELQQTLGVDYQQVEARVQEMVKSDSSLCFAIGQLISRDYLNSVCQELNCRLQEDGQLTLSQVTKSLDLPSELLQAEMEASMGWVIQGFFDADDHNVLYTSDFIQLQKATIRGFLSGSSKVISVSRAVSELVVQPTLFFRLLDELLAEGALRGQLVGGRHVDRALFVPQLYTDLLRSYAQEFFAQNGYLTLSSFKKLGICDMSQYAKDVLDGKELRGAVHLKNAVLSEELWTGLVANVEERVQQMGWVDVAECLPSDLSTAEDAHEAAASISKLHPEWRLTDDDFLYSSSVAQKWSRLLDEMLEEKAVAEAPNLKKLLAEAVAENSEDWKGGKKKGGKKGGGKKREESKKNEPGGALEFLAKDQLVETLRTADEASLPNSVLSELAEEMRPKLNARFRERIQSAFLSSQADAFSQHKRSHSEFQEQFRLLYQNINMFDSGASFFDDFVAAQLRSFLLRSLCADAANLALSFVSGVQVTSKSSEAAVKNLESAESKDAFRKLLTSVSGKREDLSEFYDAVEDVAGPSICSLKLRPPDKKTRAELQKQQLKELGRQLEECMEPSDGLLLCLLILFSVFHEAVLHASGKFVPALSALIQKKSEADLQSLISDTQKLVIKRLKEPKADASVAEDLNQKFTELKAKTLERLAEKSTTA